MQQAAGMGDALLHQPGVRRHARGALEHAGKVEGRQVNRRRQFFQRGRFGQPRLQQLFGLAHRPVFHPRLGRHRQAGMAVEQGEHHLSPERLLMQRRLRPFQQMMQLLQPVKQLRVVQQGVVESGQVGAGQVQLFHQALDLLVVRVERTVAPPGIMAFVAVMHFVRVDQHQCAGASQVLCTAIAITLGAVHDHADHKTIMHMGHKAVFDVARGEQFDAVQRRRLPKVDGLTLLHIHYADSGLRLANHCGMRRSR